MPKHPVKTPVRKARKWIDNQRLVCLRGTGHKSCRGCTANNVCELYQASELLKIALKELDKE
jgi:hypothetical protein